MDAASKFKITWKLVCRSRPKSKKHLIELLFAKSTFRVFFYPDKFNPWINHCQKTQFNFQNQVRFCFPLRWFFFWLNWSNPSESSFRIYFKYYLVPWTQPKVYSKVKLWQILLKKCFIPETVLTLESFVCNTNFQNI
jgi:hypothetical protein